jgi:hypothetical protein
MLLHTPHECQKNEISIPYYHITNGNKIGGISKSNSKNEIILNMNTKIDSIKKRFHHKIIGVLHLNL